jgi:hypothetical protein
VKPADAKGNFGYCEKCGIVYALRARTTGEWGREAPRPFEGEFGEETKEQSRPRTPAPVEPGEQARASAFLWRCPDCDTELRADNDVDLQFLKREHIRGYHPNR